MVALRSDKDEWMIDSAATSTYEIGSEPDDRGNALLEKHNRNRSHHIARQVCMLDCCEINKHRKITDFLIFLIN